MCVGPGRAHARSRRSRCASRTPCSRRAPTRAPPGGCGRARSRSSATSPARSRRTRRTCRAIRSDTVGAGQTVSQLRRRLVATRELADALGTELAGPRRRRRPAPSTSPGPRTSPGARTGRRGAVGRRVPARALRRLAGGEGAVRRGDAAARHRGRRAARRRPPPSTSSPRRPRTTSTTASRTPCRCSMSLATYGRAGDTALMDADAATGLDVIGIGDFRNLVAGQSICLIANSERVATVPLGAEIDEYDLVVRFNSYAIDPPATGRRTDIHATIHLHDFNWDQQVADPARLRRVSALAALAAAAAWCRARRTTSATSRCAGPCATRRSPRRPGDPRHPDQPASTCCDLLDFLDVNPVHRPDRLRLLRDRALPASRKRWAGHLADARVLPVREGMGPGAGPLERDRHADLPAMSHRLPYRDRRRPGPGDRRRTPSPAKRRIAFASLTSTRSTCPASSRCCAASRCRTRRVRGLRRPFDDLTPARCPDPRLHPRIGSGGWTPTHYDVVQGRPDNYLVRKAYFILDVFRIRDYDTVITLDTDMVVLGDLERLLDVREGLAPSSSSSTGQHKLNCGLLVSTAST